MSLLWWCDPKRWRHHRPEHEEPPLIYIYILKIVLPCRMRRKRRVFHSSLLHRDSAFCDFQSMYEYEYSSAVLQYMYFFQTLFRLCTITALSIANGHEQTPGPRTHWHQRPYGSFVPGMRYDNSCISPLRCNEQQDSTTLRLRQGSLRRRGGGHHRRVGQPCARQGGQRSAGLHRRPHIDSP